MAIARTSPKKVHDELTKLAHQHAYAAGMAAKRARTMADPTPQLIKLAVAEALQQQALEIFALVGGSYAALASECATIRARGEESGMGQ